MDIITYILGGWLIIAIIFVAYGREKTWAKIYGPADLGAVDFPTLAPSKKPNHALFCPVDYCPKAGKFKTSPIFDMPIDTLQGKLFDIVEAEQNINQVAADAKKQQYRYVQYTHLMRYPDTIRIQFVDMGNGKSSLAIYSESQIGHGDMGVNYKRIQKWIKKLSAL